MTSEFKCMQCASSQASPVFLDCEDYYLQKPYRTDYYRCGLCGMTQQSPIPTDVSRFYEAYPIHQKKGIFFRMMRQWIMGACYFDTRKVLAGKEVQSVLVDFGCGDGWLLDASRNPKLSLAGLESDPDQHATPGYARVQSVARTTKWTFLYNVSRVQI